MSKPFAARVIDWQKQHGRHDLPWQNTRDPYAIWVSEIMLQQTQVTTVIGYYQRFMERFPDIHSLAAADLDDVLQRWSGLGYYSRARNLHAAARMLMEAYGGAFPATPDSIQQLPGIGRSTAAAIAAFSTGHRCAILDGNVKRVLCRCFGIEGWPGHPAIEKKLWDLAESLLPEDDIEAYTQGVMDLGASLCSRSKPACILCPLQDMCVACSEGRAEELPSPKPRKTIPERCTAMLLLLTGNEILLEKRPSIGIWGGLWSLPEMDTSANAQDVARTRFGLETQLRPVLPTLTHAFSHFKLHIIPHPLHVSGKPTLPSGCGAVWLDFDSASGAAIPTPVRRLIQQITVKPGQ